MMTPRELAGEIRRAKTVYVWVQYHTERGCYLAMPKSVAREVVQDARENKVQVHADTEEGELYIGGEDVAVEPTILSDGASDEGE